MPSLLFYPDQTVILRCPSRAESRATYLETLDNGRCRVMAAHGGIIQVPQEWLRWEPIVILPPEVIALRDEQGD